ncbi:hypothetical protein [Methanoregula sp.]|uniref:hypothetical protein n=1 Tax=Methanoregula sp. TaxID=2052170 RepID=UPI002CE6EAC5|nr:hypothetical protein [Methanoregula sp.]HVP96437.1 hypothetical protein [Methanoregula sp.]
MNRCLISCTLLVVVALLGAGCVGTGTQAGNGINSTPSLTPLTPVSLIPTMVATTPPPLSLGNQYISRSYSFSGMNNTYSEQIRITDPSWAITYKITNLSDTPQDCRFAIKVTNLDTLTSRTLTWTYLNDTYQQYPMYTPGLYQFAMTGTLVKVDLTVAQRLP